MSRKKFIPWFSLLGILALLPLILSSTVLFFMKNLEEFFGNPTLLGTILFFIGITISMTLALTPTTFIAVLSGYFFSWLAFPMVILSYMIAASLGLLFGKKLNILFNLSSHTKNSTRWNALVSKFKHNALLLVIFGRLSPALPFAMMNVALSAINISWKNYLAGSLLGMLPRTFLFFLAGKNAKDVWAFLQHPSAGIAYKLIPLGLMLISIAGISWISARNTPVPAVTIK